MMFCFILLTQILFYSRAVVIKIAVTLPIGKPPLCYVMTTSHRWKATEHLCSPSVSFLSVLSGKSFDVLMEN